MIDNNIKIVKIDYKVASDKQIGYMKSLFWKYAQIKLGDRFDTNSWELKSQRYWNNFLTKHPELLVAVTLDDLHGCMSLYRIDSFSASAIINYLKPTVEANSSYQYKKTQFVSRFSQEYFNQLKTA